MMFCCEYSEVLRCLLCYAAAVAVAAQCCGSISLRGDIKVQVLFTSRNNNRINMIQPVQKNCFADLIFIHEYWAFQFGETENIVFS